MDESSKGLEQRVWQRVLSRQEAPRGDLRALELEALEAAAVYRHLLGSFQGKQQALIRQLYEGQQRAAACLRGLMRLSVSGLGKPVRLSPSGESAGKALEKRYHSARHAMEAYMAWSVDGEFGTVFQRLAEERREECVLLAQILGGL